MTFFLCKKISCLPWVISVLQWESTESSIKLPCAKSIHCCIFCLLVTVHFKKPSLQLDIIQITKKSKPSKPERDNWYHLVLFIKRVSGEEV